MSCKLGTCLLRRPPRPFAHPVPRGSLHPQKHQPKDLLKHRPHTTHPPTRPDLTAPSPANLICFSSSHLLHTAFSSISPVHPPIKLSIRFSFTNSCLDDEFCLIDRIPTPYFRRLILSHPCTAGRAHNSPPPFACHLARLHASKKGAEPQPRIDLYSHRTKLFRH